MHVHQDHTDNHKQSQCSLSSRELPHAGEQVCCRRAPTVAVETYIRPLSEIRGQSSTTQARSPSPQTAGCRPRGCDSCQSCARRPSANSNFLPRKFLNTGLSSPAFYRKAQFQTATLFLWHQREAQYNPALCLATCSIYILRSQETHSGHVFLLKKQFHEKHSMEKGAPVLL